MGISVVTRRMEEEGEEEGEEGEEEGEEGEDRCSIRDIS